jgi:DGQHR domain-containing protein
MPHIVTWSNPMEEQKVKFFSTTEEAFRAASNAAMSVMGPVVPGTMYRQGGRRMVVTCLPYKVLAKRVQIDSTPKRGGDPQQHRNRPIEKTHVREIIDYLTTEEQYIFGNIMLSASEPLSIFAVRPPDIAVAESFPHSCYVVLSDAVELHVTDGQHRISAIEEILNSGSELAQRVGNDSIPVQIVEEPDLRKIHQDFYDCAQTLQLQPALLVNYDSRELINWITREVCEQSRVFLGRIENTASVSQKSLMLFNINQVKNGLLQLLVGDWELYADALEQQARQRLSASKDTWRASILAFFEEFTEHNVQWRQVRDNPLATGGNVPVPDFREHYLHFTGCGMLVLCGVGHQILMSGSVDGALSQGQREQIQKLATINWSRHNNPLWQGNVVNSEGRISAQKPLVARAVARVKHELQLPLTGKEQQMLSASATGTSRLPGTENVPAGI